MRYLLERFLPQPMVPGPNLCFYGFLSPEAEKRQEMSVDESGFAMMDVARTENLSVLLSAL